MVTACARPPSSPMSSSISFTSELDDALDSQGGSPRGCSPMSRRRASVSRGGIARRVRSRELIDAPQSAVVAEACKHEILFHGICGVCGELVVEHPPTGALPMQTPNEAGAGVASHVELRYLGGLQVRREYLLQQHANAKAALLQQRKLGLVLDLDHTLLHSKQTSTLTAQDQEACKQASAVGGRAMLCSTPHMTTKLRPGVFAFLQALSERFTMFIYTMGDASYAHNMANLLDPDRAGWFLNRIIDRGDSDWAAHQKGLSKVSAADMTAIIDDTVGVWKQDVANVLRVQRYRFFQEAGLDAASLSATRSDKPHVDEHEDSNQLRDIAAVLLRLHAAFFGSAQPETQDVRSLLRDMKSRVLKGCSLVFSRSEERRGGVQVIDQNSSEAPERNSLWQLALRLGGLCQLDVTPACTHIVSLSAQTAKSQLASKLGAHVVSPDWLVACDARWTRVEEALYPAPRSALHFREWLSMQQLEDAQALAAAGGAASS